MCFRNNEGHDGSVSVGQASVYMSSRGESVHPAQMLAQKPSHSSQPSTAHPNGLMHENGLTFVEDIALTLGTTASEGGMAQTQVTGKFRDTRSRGIVTVFGVRRTCASTSTFINIHLLATSTLQGFDTCLKERWEIHPLILSLLSDGSSSVIPHQV